MIKSDPLKLIYIAGYGRSGSTLLDIALGAHPNLFGAGEVGEFTRHVWAENEFCACGNRVRSCPLWSNVFDSWVAGDENLLEDYLKSQVTSETILSPRRILGQSGGRFSSRTKRLFEQISRASDRRVVVDSNKIPGRGFVLAGTPGLDLYVVHLVRDPRAVTFSMMKAIKQKVEAGVQKELRPKPLLHTALRWLIVNLATEVLALKVGRKRSIRVRYEDFVADPTATVERVLRLVGEESRDLPDGISTPLIPRHQVSGSRHRMQKQLLIETDEAWRAAMSPARRFLVALLCAPLLWRYGYRWRIDDPAALREVLA
jgi:hypothetical protein